MSRKASRTAPEKSLRARLGGLRGPIAYLVIISGAVNILALTGAFYMLQVYDRVLTSKSFPTLAALSILVIGLYLIQGLLDIIRSQTLVRLGSRLDQQFSPLAHRVAIDMPRFGFSTPEANERGRDVDVLRHFVSSQGPIAFFDLPWIPLYLAFVYLLHPYLGLLTLGGALVLTSLTVITELLTHKRSIETQKAGLDRASIADTNTRNADVLHAMGFAHRAIARFDAANKEHLALHAKTNDVTGSFSGLSKVMRMMLQSAVLGLGAFLTIRGELSAGAIIAASVAASRALAPVDLVIGQWKNVIAARRSYHRLGETLATIDDEKPHVQLPAPKTSLTVENVTVAAPRSGSVILADVAFELQAGQAIGLIGPSGGGKSSLVRGLLGVWPLVRGSIRIDGAEIDQWAREDLGQHIGYLPQEVALLDGTVAENICRFDPNPNNEKILEASRAADVHDLIIHLPNGYQTGIGPDGIALSAGQRQRIALARALYGKPFLVVLDEPNSNLDAEGDKALTAAITGVKERGGIVVVVAHRPSALAACDLVGVLQNGRLAAFGPKDTIIQDKSSTSRTTQPTRVALQPNVAKG